MNDLFDSRYEDSSSKTSFLLNKKNKSKRKEIKLSINELFHSDLYGKMPLSFSTPLPELVPYCGELPHRLVPFNEAYANKDYDCTVHFYIHDRLFLRVLLHPEKYLDFFQLCNSVIDPDLSQYADMPAEIRYYNSCINRLFSVYLQKNNVNLIPNVTWSLPDSYSYSWSAMPRNSVIAINCTGILKHDLSKYLWCRGYKEAVSTLHPSHIIRYGTRMPYEQSEISLYFVNERLKRLRHGS